MAACVFAYILGGLFICLHICCFFTLFLFFFFFIFYFFFCSLHSVLLQSGFGWTALTVMYVGFCFANKNQIKQAWHRRMISLEQFIDHHSRRNVQNSWMTKLLDLMVLADYVRHLCCCFYDCLHFRYLEELYQQHIFLTLAWPRPWGCDRWSTAWQFIRVVCFFSSINNCNLIILFILAGDISFMTPYFFYYY